MRREFTPDEGAETQDNRPNFGIVFKSSEEDAQSIFEFIEDLPSSYIVYRTRAWKRLWIKREEMRTDE